MRLDHFVLSADDVDALCEFYAAFDGIEIEELPGDRRALDFGTQKVNLHDADVDHDLLAEEWTVGSGDFCLVTERPLAEVQTELDERGIEVVEGPVDRQGAVEPLTSIYFHDPEGNLVEIANVRE